MSTIHRAPLRNGVSSADITADIVRYYLHEGQRFFVSQVATVASGADFYVLFSTPNTDTKCHATMEVTVQYESSMVWYGGATISDNGTAVDIVNRNGNSSITPEMAVYYTPTITDPGSSKTQYKVGDGRKLGGHVAERQVILAKNTNYLFKITNDSNQDSWVMYQLDWFETPHGP